jgi:hypothetical protein
MIIRSQGRHLLNLSNCLIETYFARAPFFFAAFFDALRFGLPPGRRGSGFFLLSSGLTARLLALSSLIAIISRHQPLIRDRVTLKISDCTEGEPRYVYHEPDRESLLEGPEMSLLRA